VELDPNPARVRALSQGLTRHGLPITRVPGFQPIAVFARDRGGALVAGASGTINWNWLHVSLLWVSEDQRRSGLGSRARPFYERHGYRLFGTLDDYPPGHQRFYLEKDLRAGGRRAPAS
jgi:hypothetical protein